jgi:hypothetical protein
MVLGLTGILLFVLILPEILAIVFGLVAISQINRSGGWQTGSGMAIAGVVLGTIELVVLLALVASGGSYQVHFGG